MKIFEAYAPSTGNVGFLHVGYDFIPLERDIYDDLSKGVPLPKSFEVQLDEYSSNKLPSKDFVSFGGGIAASESLDSRMKALLVENCHTIALLSPFGNYTYYIPKRLIAAVDFEKSELRKYPDDFGPNNGFDFLNLVIDASKIGDIPIFQLAPEPMCEVNYVTEVFVKLYKECRCKGLRFMPVDTSHGQ
jgi:hypothetical protein